MEENRYAILIGCNNYDNLPKLHCSVNDVLAMEKVLHDPEISGFNKVIKFIDDEPSYKIAREVEKVITGSGRRSTDTILLYFSGHGKLDQLEIFISQWRIQMLKH